MLAALGLEALISGFGVTLPSGSLVFAPRTVLVGLIVGAGVTLVVRDRPGRRAVRIPPVAALSDRQADGERLAPAPVRLGRGLAMAAPPLAVGLTQPAIALVGAGAVCIFVGVAMLAPGDRAAGVGRARPSAGPCARQVGEAGAGNSMRSPQAHGADRLALMVGLALVSAIAVFGASLSKSATSSVVRGHPGRSDHQSAEQHVWPASATRWHRQPPPGACRASAPSVDRVPQARFEFKNVGHEPHGDLDPRPGPDPVNVGTTTSGSTGGTERPASSCSTPPRPRTINLVGR